MEVSEFWQRKGWSSLAAGVSSRFPFFSLENPSFGMLTISNIGKDLILHKNVNQTQNFYAKS